MHQRVGREVRQEQVDAHTHLDSCGGKDPASVVEIVERAEAVGVVRIITVGCAEDRLDDAIMAAEAHPNVYAALAQHPMDAHRIGEDGKERLAELAAHPRVVAIGETGLDYYWIKADPENIAPKEVQHDLFRWHIDLAKQLDKPLMVHNRDADADTLAILDEVGAPERTIIHCFSSTLDFAKECARRSFYVTFGGATTFKANNELREVVKYYPRDLMMVETDAPYLMPEPFRGNRNEPQYVAYTAYRLAEELDMDPAEFAALTTRNASAVYAIPYPKD
ncbi:MAG TPA: TatD family hydrolase [Corynebacteriales bacterium]|nr:TatD family hydrolase [Mycobacteriales bacterium]